MVALSVAALLILALVGSLQAASAAKQGVFLLSNQPTNEVGVWESTEDGALVWQGRYETGGVGYPDPNDENGVDDLGSSNAIHYHVYDNRQWLLASNAGGPALRPAVVYAICWSVPSIWPNGPPILRIRWMDSWGKGCLQRAEMARMYRV